jgi:RIO kinase 1
LPDPSEDRFDPNGTSTAHDDTLGVAELDAFAQQGLITHVHAQLKSGKEATVYCCRAHPSTNRKFLAAKVYRDHTTHAYRRSGPYFEGRERTMKARTIRAIERGSTFGHRAMAGAWMSAEYDALRRLTAVDADVPRPIAQCGAALLMDYVGNGAGPAPHLHGVELDMCRAERLLEQLVTAIETMLSAHLVHGDLSPYNILIWKGRPWIIDLPQAIDVRFNRSAFELLSRDVENVCAFFAGRGVQTDPGGLAEDLWRRYQRAEL